MEQAVIIRSKTLENGRPKNFRTCLDPIENVNTIGLDRLRISGSGQFAKDGLDFIVEKIKDKHNSEFITICDLRGEPHAIVDVDDEKIPISWYITGNRLGENLDFIEIDELNRKYVDSINLNEKVTISTKEGEKSEVLFKNISTEEVLVREELNLGYIRVPIVDHEKPEVRDVDSIIWLYKTIPPKTWIHFHCAAGKGRTTTAMLIIDMIENRYNTELRFDDFILRHHLLGGADFRHKEFNADKQWKLKMANERYDLLCDFWNFIKNSNYHSHGLMYYSTYLNSLKSLTLNSEL